MIAARKIGRRCAWCGRADGVGFSALVHSLAADGVQFRHLAAGYMQFLHPPCAARAKRAAWRIRTAAALAGQVTA